MFGMFGNRKKRAAQVPKEFRRTRTGLFGLFKKKIEEDAGYRKHRRPPAERFRQALLNLFKKPAAAPQRKSGPPRLPSEFRRSPFYKRLPEWSAGQAAGLRKALLRFPSVAVSVLRMRLASWFLCLLGLTGGVALGAFVTRQRLKTPTPLASAGGSVITEREFQHRMETMAGPEVMSTMVSEQILLQFARQKHALPSESEVSARVRQTLARPIAAQGILRNQPGQEDLRDLARVALAQEHLFGSASQVTEEEISAYYQQQSSPNTPNAKFYTPESVSISVIVTPSEEEIRRAMQALQQGQPFDQAARTFSKDPSAFAGGIEPPIYRGRTGISAVPGFEAAAFSLQPGQTLPPRKFLGAWFIVHCREKQPASTRPLATVHEECRYDVQLLKSASTQGLQLTREFAQFRRQSRVQVFWEWYLNSLSGPAGPASDVSHKTTQ